MNNITQSNVRAILHAGSIGSTLTRLVYPNPDVCSDSCFRAVYAPDYLLLPVPPLITPKPGLTDPKPKAIVSTATYANAAASLAC